ncbi:MAG: hypothetical protein ACFFAH_03310 [Promethearchaeota archaeon]
MVKHNISSIKLRRIQWKELLKITVQYKQGIQQAFEFLKDSKDFLEFKRMKKSIDEEIYLGRLKSLINMAAVYFYSLHEGFTRDFFKEVISYDGGMSGSKFDEKYDRFHDIIVLMRRRYHIRLPKEIFDIIDKLRMARNSIVHGMRDARPEFKIIELCYETIMNYFDFVQFEMSRKLHLV